MKVKFVILFFVKFEFGKMSEIVILHSMTNQVYILLICDILVIYQYIVSLNSL